MRLFFALCFDEEMEKSILQVQNQLRQAGVRGRYTNKENLHLTLSFIGEYPNPKKVLQVAQSIKHHGFSCQSLYLQSFREMILLRMRVDKSLYEYVDLLREGLEEQKIPFDPKDFKPHITLIRQAFDYNSDMIRKIRIEKTETLIEQVSLMSSTFEKQGVRYAEVGSVERI